MFEFSILDISWKQSLTRMVSSLEYMDARWSAEYCSLEKIFNASSLSYPFLEYPLNFNLNINFNYQLSISTINFRQQDPNNYSADADTRRWLVWQQTYAVARLLVQLVSVFVYMYLSLYLYLSMYLSSLVRLVSLVVRPAQLVRRVSLWQKFSNGRRRCLSWLSCRLTCTLTLLEGPGAAAPFQPLCAPLMLFYCPKSWCYLDQTSFTIAFKSPPVESGWKW